MMHGPRAVPRGYTYVGVLLAVVLAGVALGAAGPLWRTTVQREREAQLIAIGTEFQHALRSYRDASPGAAVLPTRLEDLVEDRRLPVTRRHLRRIYVDPMTGRAEWGLVREGDRIAGVHSLSNEVAISRPPLLAAGSGETPHAYRDWVFRWSDGIVAPEEPRGGQALRRGS
jgi:type II secretory pathway pseudopilin PulG